MLQNHSSMYKIKVYWSLKCHGQSIDQSLNETFNQDLYLRLNALKVKMLCVLNIIKKKKERKKNHAPLYNTSTECATIHSPLHSLTIAKLVLLTGHKCGNRCPGASFTYK